LSAVAPGALAKILENLITLPFWVSLALFTLKWNLDSELLSRISSLSARDLLASDGAQDSLPKFFILDSLMFQTELRLRTLRFIQLVPTDAPDPQHEPSQNAVA